MDPINEIERCLGAKRKCAKGSALPPSLQVLVYHLYQQFGTSIIKHNLVDLGCLSGAMDAIKS